MLHSRVRSDGPPPSGGVSPGAGWDAMSDAAGVNCTKGTPTDIMAQVPRIWAKGCLLDNLHDQTRHNYTSWMQGGHSLLLLLCLLK